MADIRFGTLGAANITPGALLQPASRNPDVAVVAIAARNRDHAQAMADKEGVEHVVDDYQAVIDHPDVNVIYNPLPISHHHEWTLKALAAGKPVLCEKSFAMNEREAVEMAEAADKAGLLLIEAFHYRYHPVFLRALEIYHAGAIGDLVRLTGHFHVGLGEREMPKDSIRMIYETGGGATMDMGCYPLSWMRHFTGEEPEVVSAEAVEGPPNVDLQPGHRAQVLERRNRLGFRFHDEGRPLPRRPGGGRHQRHADREQPASSSPVPRDQA